MVSNTVQVFEIIVTNLLIVCTSLSDFGKNVGDIYDLLCYYWNIKQEKMSLKDEINLGVSSCQTTSYACSSKQENAISCYVPCVIWGPILTNVSMPLLPQCSPKAWEQIVPYLGYLVPCHLLFPPPRRYSTSPLGMDTATLESWIGPCN